MDKHFSLEDALTLIEDAERNLDEVKKYYRSSMITKSVDKRLPLRIKSLFDCIRSALDYCAVALVDTYSDKKPRKTYFPYANKETSIEQFLKKGKFIDKSIPNLREKNEELFEFIVSIQHFAENKFQFVPDIFALNNKNKHFRLMPSEIHEKIDVKLGGIHLRGNSLTMSEGAKIITDEGVVTGPVKVDSSSIPESGKVGDAKVSEWTDIKIVGFAYPLNAQEFSQYAVDYAKYVIRTIYQLTP